MTDNSFYLTHLECTKTGEKYDAGELQNLSAEGAPLSACYDFEALGKRLSKEALSNRSPNMWRYREMLPVRDSRYVVTLDEGWTPIHHVSNLGSRLGLRRLMIKDESQNPTGSFKSRGISAAISAAMERGAGSFSIPSAGNAAGALAAYAAAAGVEAHVFMPEDTPLSFKLECEYYGARVKLIDGLISECGQVAAEECKKHGRFDVSTLKEPYRLEGKKTMGLEIAEQLNWELPDVIIYPTGGGTGLIGMWKAFAELERLGWINGPKPRMVAVQSEGCAPIVRAFEQGKERAEPWNNARTISAGIRVPSAIGDFLILKALRESDGTAVAVSDEETLEFSREMAEHTGIFPAPEGGATLAALARLKEKQLVGSDEKVLLLNTGSGYKYLEALNSRYPEKMAESLA